MNTYTVTIDREFIERCTVTGAHIDEFNTIKGRVEDVDLVVNSVCNRFTERFIKFVEANDGMSCYMQKYTTVEGVNRTVIKLKNTAKTSVLFEPFKKLGIILGDLVVHFDDGDTSNFYLPLKMLRDFTKFNTTTANALAMYIVSVAKSIQSFIQKPASVDDVMYGKPDYRTALQAFADANIFGFTNPNYVFNFNEIQVADIVSYSNCNTSYAQVPSVTMMFENNSLQYAIAKTEGGTPSVFVSYTNGMSRKCYYLINPSGIVTNSNMCTLDMECDSITTRIASAVNKPDKPFSVYTSKIPMAEFQVAEEIELLELSTRGKPFVERCEHALKETLGASSDFNFKEAEEDLHVTFKKIGDFFDSESIKSSYDSDSYAQQLYKQVQPYYDTFDLKSLTSCVKGFAKGDLYAMLFVGDSGTGKSTAAKVLPYRCGIPFVCINFSTNIEESDLFGTMIPNAEKKTAEDPEFVWQDGVLTKAIRNGYCAVLEEINFARAGVLGKLNSLLDENRQMDLPNGEIVKAHPNFRMIATCNVAYEGTNRLNKALVNRFDSVVVFEDVCKDEAMSIITSRTGYNDTKKMDVVYNVYSALKKFSKEQNLGLVVSLRQLLTLFKQGKYYKNAEEAIRNVLINGAFIEEQEYLEEFCKTVLPAFKLNFKL